MGTSLVTVIPISRGVFKDSLSYFTAQDIGVGDLVSVVSRGKKIPALVVTTEAATHHKSGLRAADFSLKKVGHKISSSFFSPEFITACQQASVFFAAHLGQVMAALTPQPILEKNLGVNYHKSKLNESYFDKYALQADEADRISSYKSMVREAFAKKLSVFLCLPTIEDIFNLAEEFSKGIGNHTFVLHSKLTKRKMIEVWSAALRHPQPILVISSGSFLPLHRPDIATIIIEKEASSAYKSISRPFIDLRHVVEFFCRARGLKLVVGDDLLRIETLYQIDQGLLNEMATSKFRFTTQAQQHKIDARLNKDRAIGDHIQTLIQNASSQNDRTLLLVNRRGIAPVTACGDCGNIVACPYCDTPLILHKTNGQNFYLCHHCALSQPAEDRCTFCKSWRLTTLGIGTQKTEAEVKKMTPNAKIYRVDSDSTKSHRAARETVAKFLSSPGSIMIGTEMALNYLREKVENIIIVSIDNIFSLNSFRIQERAVHLLLKAKGLATKNFVIQTRRPDDPIFETVLSGNMIEFSRRELASRQRFLYPPFTNLIRVSRQHLPQRTAEFKKLELKLQKYQPIYYLAGGKDNLLLKLKEWPVEELSSFLRNLPPSFVVQVDPDELT